VSQWQQLRRGLTALALLAGWFGAALWAQSPAGWLTWDYESPMPATNDQGGPIRFEIWQSPDLHAWTLLLQTNQPPVALACAAPRMFYKCRAYEVYGSVTNYSDWACR